MSIPSGTLICVIATKEKKKDASIRFFLTYQIDVFFHFATVLMLESAHDRCSRWSSKIIVSTFVRVRIRYEKKNQKRRTNKKKERNEREREIIIIIIISRYLVYLPGHISIDYPGPIILSDSKQRVS